MDNAPVRVPVLAVRLNRFGTELLVEVNASVLRFEWAIVKDLGQANGWVLRRSKKHMIDAVSDFRSKVQKSENFYEFSGRR